MSQFPTPPDRLHLPVQLRGCELSSFPLFTYSESLTGAGPMQAPGLFDIADKRGKFGLVHNIGLGGAVVISLLRRPEFYEAGGVDGKTRQVTKLGIVD